MVSQEAEDIVDVFWFGKPELYFECVQLLFMVISFYLALWLTVMLSAAPSDAWKFLSILPILIVCVFFFYIVKTAALLKAVYVVDTDAMLEVIEETEAAKQLSDELRAKVVAVLNEEGDDAYIELERFYKEIDTNGNDSLSRSEFGEFMELMGITFSRKKWERIYKEIDRNYDNQISLHEFYLFLYPDHDRALTMEMKRLKAISQRVMSKASKFLSQLTPFREYLGERSLSMRGLMLGGSPTTKQHVAPAVKHLQSSVKAVSKFKAVAHLSGKHAATSTGATPTDSNPAPAVTSGAASPPSGAADAATHDTASAAPSAAVDHEARTADSGAEMTAFAGESHPQVTNASNDQ